MMDGFRYGVLEVGDTVERIYRKKISFTNPNSIQIPKSNYRTHRIFFELIYNHFQSLQMIFKNHFTLSTAAIVIQFSNVNA